MTDLLSRPAAAASATPAQPRPAGAGSLALYGLLAAAWTAAIGLVPLIAVAVAGWFAADSGTFGDAIRVGGLAWLMGNGSGLELRAASITLLPLGAVAVNGWLLHRAGRWVGSHVAAGAWSEVAAGVLGLSAGYVGLAAVASIATSSSAAHANPGRTLGITFLLAVTLGGLGAVRAAGRLRGLAARLPEEFRAAATGGAAGLLALVGGSAALLTASLVGHFSTAVTLAEEMHAGLVGGAITTLISLALVPNAVFFAGAFLSGPGFAIGTGTVVAPGKVSTGALPGFPLLAAVPRTPGSTWLEVGLLLLPAAAGAVAGLLAVRRFPVATLRAAMLRGGLAGLSAGAAFGLLALLSGGAAGPGRMQAVGPGALVLLAVTLTCLPSGAVAGAATRWVSAWRAGAARAD